MNIKDTQQAAQRLMSQNELEKADCLFCAVLEQDPSHLGVHIQRGHILRRQGKRKEALSYFKKILGMHPNQSLALLELANEFRDQKYYKAAEECYQHVPKNDSRYFGALMGLGISARRQARREQALSYFQQAASFNPEVIDAVLQVATELRVLNRMAESDAVYQTVLKQGRRDFSALEGGGAVECA